MLTKKELLNYKKSKGNIIPSFIKPDDFVLNKFSESLVSLFSNSLGLSRADLEQETACILSAFEIDSIIQKGLLKLLMDRLTFESSFSGNISEFRNSVFINSNDYIHSEKTLNLIEYKKEVAENLKLKSDDLEFLLYSDLPEFNKVTKFKEISPIGLINRYNIALVQGLLYYCEYIQIKLFLSDCNKGDLRYLLKQTRFFQLSIQINKNDDSFEILLDGPLSLFLHTQKYGFNLAAFFPSLVLIKKWELEAKIEIGKLAKQQGILKLNHKSPLLSHYKMYSSYIPEDFIMFESLFLEKSNEWKIQSECDDILYDGKNYFFPDYKFVKNDKFVYLELFHSWHKLAIKQRILNFEKNPSCLLIVGISKALLKDIEIKQIVENSIFFKSKGFIFREMPTVSQVLDKLADS